MLSPSLATLLALVFAPGASAATCADGSCVGSNGCCAATNECPPCLHQLIINTETNTRSVQGFSETTPSAQNTRCECYGCAGETVTIVSTCTHDSCDRGTGSRGSGPGCTCGSVAGCDYCSGLGGTCMPNAAELSACSLVRPVISISSSGLISAAGDNPGSGGNVCNRCLGYVCNLPGSAEDSILPSCPEDFTCPEDSAAASLGSGALGTTLLAVTTTALLRGLRF